MVESIFLTGRGADEEYVCDQPYAYNAGSQAMVSFDDAKSFRAKGESIKSHGLRGYAMTGRLLGTITTSYSIPSGRVAGIESRVDLS